MHPVLGRLADKVLLISSGRGITLDRVSLRSDEVIQAGKLDHKRIIVILEKRLRIQPRREYRPEIPPGLFLHCQLDPPASGKLTSCFLMIF